MRNSQLTPEQRQQYEFQQWQRNQKNRNFLIPIISLVVFFSLIAFAGSMSVHKTCTIHSTGSLEDSQTTYSCE